MKLELLPNEILLDLFDYLNHTDLLWAFYGLNSRFNFLLYNQIRFYCLNLNFISKRSFDMICQQHLSFIANRLITLCLSDYRETPEQINLFCSSIPSFNIFTHLQSLSLSNLRSYKTLIRIVYQCQNLCNLTHLKFYSCTFPSSQADFQLIVSNIWSLSKLTTCHFGIDTKNRTQFYMPTFISVSLECITISNGKFKWNQINRLFHYTPCLKHFSTDVKSFTDNDYLVSPLPSLIKFNLLLFSDPTVTKLIALCQSMPNLYRLDITMLYKLIDGHTWEHIIRNYLPKLKTFRIQMQENFDLLNINIPTISERVDKLINSFRSLFWIDEHQWFARCITQNRTIHLYTLPNTSDYYKDIFPDSWKSTYPQDNQQEFYNSITTIYNEIFFDQSISSNIRLPNINYLRIKFPINDQFWSIVPSLNRLNTLIISSYTDIFQSQLQTLLNRAPYLHTLRISQDTSLPFQISFKDTDTSVRCLNLYDSIHSFNNEECILLSRSSVCAQCEVLWISVNNRKSIIDFVKNMINLRVLIVKCTDEKHRKQSTLTRNNEIIQWLKDRLSSTCFIVKDINVDSNIIIWM